MTNQRRDRNQYQSSMMTNQRRDRNQYQSSVFDGSNQHLVGQVQSQQSLMSNFPPPFPFQPWFPLRQFSYNPTFDLAHLPDLRRAALNSSLPSFILFQIDYYFSDENLVKDTYLRSQMDDQGWVSIFVIAEFPRIKSMTNDIEVLLCSMRSSTNVELQVTKLRKRYEWEKWIIPRDSINR